MKRFRYLLVLALALTAIISGCTGNAGSDTTAPSVPTSLVTIATSTSKIDLTWSASTDGVGVTGYNVYRNGIYLKSEPTISTIDTGLTPSTQYCYQVTAYDAAGNESAKCVQECVTTLMTDVGMDTTAPSVPTSLVTTVASTSQISLTWAASADTVGVTGYKVYRDGTYLKSEMTISTIDTGLTPSPQYCYQVTAYDAVGNESAKCMQACATTQTQGDKIYSFEGVISNLYYDGGGIIANIGYKIGDPIFAKFTVDFEEKGYFILNNGETIIPENPQLTNDPHWYFYDALIDGTLMPVVNGGFYNSPTDIKEYYCGYDESGPMGNRGVLEGGTGNSSFTILKESLMDASVQNWVIGEHLKGIIVSYSDKGSSVMWADMILTDIKTIP